VAFVTQPVAWDERKQILLDYYDATLAVDFDRVGSFFTDDCKVWLPPSAGRHGTSLPLVGREKFIHMVRAMMGGQLDMHFWKPRSFAPLGFYVDGDTVAVHLRHVGDMPDGAVYDNDYLFIYTFEGDKIAEMWEFTDTTYVGDFLAEHAPRAG
jgi:ketosteroid isomerase-like protein